MIALALFVYIGQRDHELVNPDQPLLGVLLTAAEFAVPWVVAGWLLGAYPRGDEVGTRSLLVRSLNTWLVAAPLGVLIRALVLGRAVIPTMFVVAAMGLGGAMVLGWRLVFVLAWGVLVHRQQPDAGALG